MISRRKLAASIVERIMSGESQSLVIKQLAAYIIDNNLESETDRLLADISQQLAEKGQLSVKVTTARRLDSKTKDEIVAYIKKVSGDKNQISIDEQVDPSIVGGVIIETPDKRLDLSVGNQIKQLRNA